MSPSSAVRQSAAFGFGVWGALTVWAALAQYLLPGRGSALGKLGSFHWVFLINLVPALLRHGAQPALRAGDGQTALGVALASGKRDVAAWLDWRGWPHPGRALHARDLASAAIMAFMTAVA